MRKFILWALALTFLLMSSCGGGTTTTSVMEEEITETTETILNPTPVDSGTSGDIVVLEPMSRTGEDGPVLSDTVILFNGNPVLDGQNVTLTRGGLVAHMSMTIEADIVTTRGPPMPVTDIRVDGDPLCNAYFIVAGGEPSSLDLADAEVVYEYNFQKFQHPTEWREVTVSGVGQIDPKLSIVLVANQLELQPVTITTTTTTWRREEIVEEEEDGIGNFGLLGLLGLAFGGNPIGTAVRLTCGDPVDADTFIVRIPPATDGPDDPDPDNLMPIARLMATPNSGELEDGQFYTTLDASASLDQDGSVLEYRFRFGDGSDQTDWLDTSAVQHYYTQDGSFAAFVDVRDEDGATDTATTSVFVMEEPTPPLPGNEPPVAILNLVGDAVGPAPFTVTVNGSDSYDTDGTIAWYEVFFYGGGGTSRGSNNITEWNNTYDTPGPYSIWLRVRDNDGAWSMTNTGIEVVVTEPQPDNNPPVAIADAIPMSGVAPLFVWFSGLLSYDPDPNDDIVWWKWNFGDGITIGSTYGWSVQHTYIISGTFATTLTVTDSHGATDTTQVGLIVVEEEANLPPVAILELVGGIATGEAPFTVTVDGSDSYDEDGYLVGYDYFFHGGGGHYEGGHNLTEYTYTYDNPGSYSIWLRVHDDDDATDWTDTGIEILVTEPEPENQPPVASFTATPLTGIVPLAVQFDASASYDTDGTIVDYQWDYQDGGGGNGITPNHTFTQPGTYWVVLTVTDDDDATDDFTIAAPVVVSPDETVYWELVDDDLNGYYGGTPGGLSLQLRTPVDSQVGYVFWHSISGPTGHEYTPLGDHPRTSCDFTYNASGVYTGEVRGYASEAAFDAGDPPVLPDIPFTITIVDDS